MKVVINGEAFEWDGSKAPMSEALAVERLYKRRYVQWQEDLQGGSAEAFCVLAWLIWRRDGRDVPYEDIIDGKADFDLGEMLNSLVEAAQAEADAKAEAESEPDPTTPAS